MPRVETPINWSLKNPQREVNMCLLWKEGGGHWQFLLLRRVNKCYKILKTFSVATCGYGLELGCSSSWLLSSLRWLPWKQSWLLRKTAGLARAPAGGREPIPLVCTVASGPGIHSLLSCQRTILDPGELAGVPCTPMSLCMNCLSLASFSGLFQRGWKELMAVNDWGLLVMVLFMHNFDRLSSYWEMASFLSFEKDCSH